MCTDIPPTFITISINKNAILIYKKVNIQLTKAMNMRYKLSCIS